VSAQRSRETKRQRVAATPPVHPRPGLVWAMLVVALAGMVVSGYLAVTYFNNAQVVCNGIGQCEQVQSSAYSRVFGVPIAYFGFASYVAIALGLAGRLAWRGDRAYLSLLGAHTLAIAGTVFSAYLTCVEFFVINATCPWCLTSAVLSALLMVCGIVQVRRESTRAVANEGQARGR
jgi:uncharacterized membrane protein